MSTKNATDNATAALKARVLAMFDATGSATDSATAHMKSVAPGVQLCTRVAEAVQLCKYTNNKKNNNSNDDPSVEAPHLQRGNNPQEIVDDLIRQLIGHEATSENLPLLNDLGAEARTRLADHKFHLQDMLRTIQDLRDKIGFTPEALLRDLRLNPYLAEDGSLQVTYFESDERLTQAFQKHRTELQELLATAPCEMICRTCRGFDRHEQRCCAVTPPQPLSKVQECRRGLFTWPADLPRPSRQKT